MEETMTMLDKTLAVVAYALMAVGYVSSCVVG